MNVVSKAVLALAGLCAAVSVMPGEAAAQSANAPASPRIHVAIVPGIAVNLDAARVDALSQDLAEALEAELDIEATGGLEVRRALPADGLPADCVAQPACIADVAQRLNANQLLFIVMVDTGAGGAIQLDSTWVEPATGKSASRPAVDVASITDARSRFEAAAPLLLPDAPKRPTPGAGNPNPRTRMSDAVPRHFTTASYITGGVAIVGLGVGIGFGLSARGKYNECDDNIFACTDSKRSTIRRRDLIADLGYVVAIGAAVATGVMFATSGKESQLVITPTEGGAAAGLVGRF
jgi:hypothetical protein